MTDREAIDVLKMDMNLITFDPMTGETIDLETVKLRNDLNYKCYLANKIAISAIQERIDRENVTHKPVTNSDRIRAMSDEDLARFLTWNVPSCINFYNDARCGCKWNCKHCDCLTVIADWLRQPAKEDHS